VLRKAEATSKVEQMLMEPRKILTVDDFL
jgi:hypothetical protein